VNDSNKATLPEVQIRLVMGDKDWRVRSFLLREALDRPYELTVTLVSERDDVEVFVEDLLGEDMVLVIERGDDERVVPAVVQQVTLLGFASGKQHVEVAGGPALGLLEQRRRSRIFQDMTVVEIVEQLVGELFDATGRKLDASRLRRNYPHRDHRAQFRETDLTFVRRILQEEGIAFRFEVEDERETMVLVDDASGFVELDRVLGEHRLVVASHNPELAGEETIHDFSWARRVRPSRVIDRQWTWKDQPRALDAEARVEDEPDEEVDAADRHGMFFVEQEDVMAPPGRDAFEPEPDTTPERAKLSLESVVAGSQRARGKGNAIGIGAGVTFELGDHPNPDFDQTYVVTWVKHTADCPQADVLDAGDGAAADYVHELVCLPIDVPYRPAQRLLKPRVRGPHIGVVTGNQEIHTDRYGRIRVRMHWDSTVDERGDGTEPTCWIRVVSPWGGFEHGLQAVPRVGSEVVIDYIDGDIDRPLCMGCLFNGQNKVLHDLPEERTRLTLRSRSSPGGDGFNELTFEDAAGAEEVFVHAQRDMNTKVRRNQSTSVGNDQSNTVGNDQAITVRNDRELTVEGHEKHAVSKDRMRRVEGTEEIIIHGSQNVHIGGGPGAGSAVDPPAAGSYEAVQGTKEIFARDKLVLQVGPSCSIVMTPMGIQIQAPSVIGLEVPNAALSVCPSVVTAKGLSSELVIGTTALLKSDLRVKHECGDSTHVTLDPMAVRAQAVTAVVDGTGMATIKGGSTTTISGHIVMVDAEGAAIISGSTVSASANGTKQTITGGGIDLD
jgi:type VI secretion system secreted protein VgrG